MAAQTRTKFLSHLLINRFSGHTFSQSSVRRARAHAGDRRRSHARKVGRQGRIHHWRRPWSRSCPRDRDGQGRCRHHRDRYLSADRVEPLSARDAGRSRGDRAVRAHESCPATAQIFGATGGYYCRYAISHTEGATFGPQPTVEDIASGWDCIRDGSLPNELDGEAMAWGVKAYSTRLQDLAAQLQDAESTKCLKSVVSLIGSSSVKLLRESSRTFAVRSHSLRKCPLVRFSPLPGHALQRPRRTRGTAKYGQQSRAAFPRTADAAEARRHCGSC